MSTECTCPSGQAGHPHASWCAKETHHASDDAKLIAELLDALVSINNCIAYSDGYGEWYLVGKFQTMPALTKVRAAIAKATGAA